jgi:hypothetical protein
MKNKIENSPEIKRFADWGARDIIFDEDNNPESICVFDVSKSCDRIYKLYSSAHGVYFIFYGKRNYVLVNNEIV